jgi:D-alanyl-lipoteichoic acid acyltransferase DltB (MBOAT superfamily)
MLFPTAAFAVFFVAAFTASWLLRPHFLVWRATMVAFSLYFYGYVDVRFAVILVASATVNWALGLAIARARPGGERTVLSRRLVALAVVANLVVLAVFRYHGFFVSSAADSLAAFGLHPTPPVLDILLPIGISFFTFHAISYVVDVGRGDLEPIAYGALLLHIGATLLAATYAYAIQIYADFSGYTDIAIGCALLLGIRLPQNFDAPYRALSVREFWHRWHMTLSRWLRDYLYIPLGGNRGGELLTYRNLMATMLLGGLWHGADWRFVVWGGLHGTYLVGERVAGAWWARRTEESGPVAVPRVVATAARWLVTFNLVCLAWVFFRADSVATAFEIIGRIATAAAAVVGTPPLVTGLLLATVGAALVSQLVPDHRTRGLRARFSGLEPAAQALILAAGLTLIVVLGPDGVAPFIYFRF